MGRAAFGSWVTRSIYTVSPTSRRAMAICRQVADMAADRAAAAMPVWMPL
ncbi:hypothetical protein BURPS1710A_4192 [Burkholderia pseudomallei 1710a]|uniref:Uncharacterized protein n=1 Tax=Burkholderia pseudomallei 1710a TaxID=320371 RepID=A0A0E1W9L1_BURPE|nr:hypothetical protein BURPS1710A_4192 [Burkholderia pseudomallei 1710a]